MTIKTYVFWVDKVRQIKRMKVQKIKQVNQSRDDNHDRVCNMTLAFDMQSCGTRLTELVSISDLWERLT